MTPYDSVSSASFLSQAAAMKRHATNAMGSRASYKLAVQFIANIIVNFISNIVNYISNIVNFISNIVNFYLTSLTRLSLII